MKEKFILDTNVAIVANGKCDHASLVCQLACIEQLENCRNLHIALDNNGLIMSEYAKHLSYAGRPGVGDMFFKYLHDNQYSRDKIHLVEITLIDDENRGFEELPVNTLDKSDRKFLATAVVAQAKIVNAVDIDDWEKARELLNFLKIEIKQLCPQNNCT